MDIITGPGLLDVTLMTKSTFTPPLCHLISVVFQTSPTPTRPTTPTQL